MHRYTEESTTSVPLAPGGRLEVESFNGSIEVTGRDGDGAEIRSKKYADSQDALAKIEVEVTHGPGWVRVKAHKPEGVRGNVGVAFVLMVPRQVALENIHSSNGSLHATNVVGPGHLKTTNGSVHVTDFEGDIDAGTSDGSIHVSNLRGAALLQTSNGTVHASGIRGAFQASTTNGTIKAEIVESPAAHAIVAKTSNGSIDLALEALNADVLAKTTNGNVTLRLPEGIGAHLVAKTSNAGVSSDFEVSSGSRSKTHIEGTLGKGGPRIDVLSSNGPIRIVRTESVVAKF
ncbi:MAG: DUF4097 domain-containing protein [Dehalococcoidia bacterium]